LNIRRWLYKSCRERRNQRSKYLRELYMGEYKDAEYEAEVASLRHFWLRTGKVGDCDRPVPRDLVALSMRNLGVQLVWCRDHSELQSRISELKAKGFNPHFGRPVDA
jgi:hypothetical protein